MAIEVKVVLRKVFLFSFLQLSSRLRKSLFLILSWLLKSCVTNLELGVMPDSDSARKKVILIIAL